MTHIRHLARDDAVVEGELGQLNKRCLDERSKHKASGVASEPSIVVRPRSWEPAASFGAKNALRD